MAMETKKNSLKTSSTRQQLPEIVRIKRKRNQDSLDALIFESKTKKVKTNKHHVFKLQRTENQIPNSEVSTINQQQQNFLPLLQELDESRTKFLIPRQQQTCEEELPLQFSEMLEDMLDLSNSTKEDNNKPLKKRKRKLSIQKNSSSDLDYVYDVYYLSSTGTENGQKIAYLHFQEDIDDGLFNGNEDSNDEFIHSDDEDSNAEDFYKNDYPEGDEEENHSEEEDNEQDQWEEEQFSNEHDFDGLYDHYYGNNNGSPPIDFLNEQLRDELESSDEDDYEKEEDIKRNIFFSTDNDDPLAIHRDKIFGDLERMINE